MNGSGTALDPYQVATAADLDDVRNDLAAYYLQTANIDLSGYSNWTPISPFEGHYDGASYSISNLTINNSGLTYAGLFGKTIVSELKNINLIAVDIAGNGGVGSLAGENSGDVTACTSSGIVSGAADGDDIGGLIGRHGPGTVTQCTTSATVTGSGSESDRVGGLIGFCNNLASIVSYCSATGAVTGVDSVGGLIGDYGGSTQALSNCFATGNVVGSTACGGLCGTIGGGHRLLNCYAMGDVSGTALVGGLVGQAYYSYVYGSNCTYCYSKGAVSGTTYVGGLVGKANAGCTFTSCYYDYQTSGQSDSGKGDPEATAWIKTQANLTAAGWDFTTVWILDALNDGYPHFIMGKILKITREKQMVNIKNQLFQFAKATWA